MTENMSATDLDEKYGIILGIDRLPNGQERYRIKEGDSCPGVWISASAGLSFELNLLEYDRKAQSDNPKDLNSAAFTAKYKLMSNRLAETAGKRYYDIKMKSDDINDIVSAAEMAFLISDKELEMKAYRKVYDLWMSYADSEKKCAFALNAMTIAEQNPADESLIIRAAEKYLTLRREIGLRGIDARVEKLILEGKLKDSFS